MENRNTTDAGIKLAGWTLLIAAIIGIAAGVIAIEFMHQMDHNGGSAVENIAGTY